MTPWRKMGIKCMSTYAQLKTHLYIHTHVHTYTSIMFLESFASAKISQIFSFVEKEREEDEKKRRKYCIVDMEIRCVHVQV